MKLSILQIIKEEIENFYSDWERSNEPSFVDKYYEKYKIRKQSEKQPLINAEIIGYVSDGISGISPSIAIYKNPKNLEGFGTATRGVLLYNNDFYLAQSYQALHWKILELLVKRGIVSSHDAQNYYNEYPKDFIAVERDGHTDIFEPSSAYDKNYFPTYYELIFYNANKKLPFKFRKSNLSEQLDPNNLVSYIPQGYEHNILDEKS